MNLKKKIIIAAAAAVIAGGGTGLGLALTSGQSGHASLEAQVTRMSAGDVAQKLGLTGFTDCGPAPAGGVTDSGTGFLGHHRMAIDTFPGISQRDKWLTTAEGFGVSPAQQSATWVVYTSTDQSAEGCN